MDFESDPVTTARNGGAAFAVYRAGALAYLDAGPGAGLVPVKVVSVETPGSGNSATAGSVTVKVTAARGPYARGETLAGERAYAVVPRNCARYRGGQCRISTLYRWE